MTPRNGKVSTPMIEFFNTWSTLIQFLMSAGMVATILISWRLQQRWADKEIKLLKGNDTAMLKKIDDLSDEFSEFRMAYERGYGQLTSDVSHNRSDIERLMNRSSRG